MRKITKKIITISTSGLLTGLLISTSASAAKKEIAGATVVPFPENPSMESLLIGGIGKIKKVRKEETVCIAGFKTSFIQQSVVQIRARTLLGDGKLRKAAGRRLVNVEKETRQAITDEAYAYARTALEGAGFKVKSDEECAALKKWDKLKVSDKATGELAELGIFSGTLKIPTGATHASRHAPTGRPDYLSLGVSPLGDVTNNAVKSIQLAKKQKIGLVDFAFALDFNVNAASAEVTVSVDKGPVYDTVTTTKKWEFDFTDALFVSTSGANFVDTKFKTAQWRSGPSTFPAIGDQSYLIDLQENSEVWDKRINAVNFDLKVDQAKYKEIYLKTIKAYIDVYVAQMAALKS